jgi:hypothetical protein
MVPSDVPELEGHRATKRRTTGDFRAFEAEDARLTRVRDPRILSVVRLNEDTSHRAAHAHFRAARAGAAHRSPNGAPDVGSDGALAMPSGREQAFDQNYERCLECLNWAVERLHGQADQEALASIAELIIRTMSGAWRLYHTPEHIFEVGKSGDAIEVLAALFHDAIFVQVDLGVSVNIGRHLIPYVHEVGEHLCILSRDTLPDDRTFEMLLDIFGFAPGQELVPTGGQNEFLSAVVAARCLDQVLDPSAVAQVAACIEATIPFRPKSDQNQQPSEQLRDRLIKVNVRFGLGWSDDDLHTNVRRAVRLANRDLENFSSESAGEFLANTWNLMPETNHGLIDSFSYTVTGYRNSLQKMEAFMYIVSPELVFQRYQDEPVTADYERLIARTRNNLEVARLYLGIKLLSIAVIEALSLRLGEGIPLATMMGELPRSDSVGVQMESFLPDIAVRIPPQTALESEVLELLEIGRSRPSSYDVNNSPVATHIIKMLGFAEALRLLVQAKAFFQNALSGEAFLNMCNQELVDTLRTSVVRLLETRIAAIRNPDPREPV